MKDQELIDLQNLLANAETEIDRLRNEIQELRAQHADEINEMQRDFQREARDIAAEAYHNAMSDDPYGTY